MVKVVCVGLLPAVVLYLVGGEVLVVVDLDCHGVSCWDAVPDCRLFAFQGGVRVSRSVQLGLPAYSSARIR